ncbi:MAG TPA: N-acetylglucosamine-6-phosphate deacetylase [Verrucomicrobiota bacterium]|nr:N-acetylglucosamine-6-phosphate deacetylase [Verrucomicrobiota bacterium]HNU52959.1 N-acetylglucosamine-6-phosphate deacetylase [Verrucomicrobiota bacterium]
MGAMKGSALVARDYRTGRRVRLVWRAGVIREVTPEPGAGRGDPWVAPALVDLQVNGFAGTDFRADSVSEADLARAIAGLHRSGCTRFLLTLFTEDWKTLLGRLRRFRALRKHAPSFLRAVVGWHIEGPFLSAAPGFRGAHPAEAMRDPSLEAIRELRRCAGPGPILLTLAPERRGAIAAIREAVALGMRVSLGHTDASAACLEAAAAAGATGFTHLGNGCPPALDRHDNILWRILERTDLTVSLIPDQVHVSPPLFRIIHRLLPPDRIIYVSDAMAGAGSGPGVYRLGSLELAVGRDQRVRLPGTQLYAGSALRPVDGVERAVAMLGDAVRAERRAGDGAPWAAAWDRFSTLPAAWMGLPSTLSPGAPADFCVIQTNRDGTIRTLQVWSGGQETE